MLFDLHWPDSDRAESQLKALCFGAILWDVIEGKEYIGGALFNLAAHLKRLGFESHMVSAIGADDRGKRAKLEADKIGIDTGVVFEDGDHPTGYVDVSTDSNNIAHYTIHENVAYDFIDLSRKAIEGLAGSIFDVICFGTLEQRGAMTRRSLLSLISAVKKNDSSSGRHTIIFCDLNLRQHYYCEETIHTSLEISDILKLNEDEVAVVRDMFFPDADFSSGYEQICAAISVNFNLEALVITKGANGCAVFSGNTFFEECGKNVTVVDTVGPGDAFSAAFLSSYLTTGNIRQAAEKANSLGAFVASRRGALPTYDSDILALFAAPKP